LMICATFSAEMPISRNREIMIAAVYVNSSDDGSSLAGRWSFSRDLISKRNSGSVRVFAVRDGSIAGSSSRWGTNATEIFGKNKTLDEASARRAHHCLAVSSGEWQPGTI